MIALVNLSKARSQPEDSGNRFAILFFCTMALIAALVIFLYARYPQYVPKEGDWTFIGA